MAREGLGGDVRDLRERLLTAPGRAADALPEPDERIDDERRARQRHQRQARVVVEEQRREGDERQRLAREVSERFGHGLLHLRDVVGDARHQLAVRIGREEGRRLSEDVREQQVADVADDALADVGHPVAGEIRADALDQIENEDRGDDLPELLVAREHAVENRLNQPGNTRGCGAVRDHRHRRGEQTPAIGPPEADQPQERVHSLNRYFSSTHSATTPSRHPIFFPSS